MLPAQRLRALRFFAGSSRSLPACFLASEYTAPLLGCLSFALFILCAFRSPLPRVLPDSAYSVFGLLYVGLSLMTIPLLSAQENGSSLLLFLFFVVWTGDVVALYVGKRIRAKKAGSFDQSEQDVGGQRQFRSWAVC